MGEWGKMESWKASQIARCQNRALQDTQEFAKGKKNRALQVTQEFTKEKKKGAVQSLWVQKMNSLKKQEDTKIYNVFRKPRAR